MGNLNTLFERWRTGFLGDVLKLSLGTLGGRLIGFLALPVLTRLYSPDDFAVLALYLALVSTLAVASCFRLEVAIPLAETDDEAAALLALALFFLTVVAAVLAVISIFLRDPVIRALRAPTLAPYLWLVPMGVVMAGSYSALQNWATRTRRFGDIARTRVTQAVAGVTAMLTLGGLGVTPLGLLLGNMLNIGAGGIRLATSALRLSAGPLRGVRLTSLASALRRNRRYPLFSTPESVFNIAGAQVPVMMIAAHAGPEAGFMMLAMQVMTAPMTLLGGAISQVYVSRAPDEYRAGRLAPFTLSIMRRLVLVGSGPLILAGALAPWVFPLIFGPEWARSGEIVTQLVPWMALQFIASPVSMVMFVVGRQRAMLALTTFGAVLRISSVGVAIAAGYPVVLVFAVSSAVFYATCCVVFMSAARFDVKRA
ncbi:MAG: lipopolysaccharide biosynthesis protein [Betaproteobacteria bacterium]